MIVYGDASLTVELREIAPLIGDQMLTGLDEMRRRLVLAGQLEQALVGGGHRTDIAEEITNRCARTFVKKCVSGKASHPALQNLLECLDPSIKLDVKVPEGFQCYGLYPDQYVKSAQQLTVSEAFNSACVIGIRTIGTSLSAVVAETLKLAGKSARRLTVRPTGDPYNRQVQLFETPSEDIVVVVDEGPGQSGSSFAAVRKALPSSARVAFLTGHAAEPGQAASESVRQVWRETPRYVHDPAPEIEEALRRQSQLVLRSRHVNVSPVLGWPLPTQAPIYAPFERPKYVAEAAGRKLLWTFYGLDSLHAGSLSELAFLHSLYAAEVGPPHLGMPVLGFVGIEMEDWQPADTVSLAEFLGYLRACRETMSRVNVDAQALPRIAKMALSNTQKIFGEEEAEKIRKISPKEAPDPRFGLFGEPHRFSYYDGRLHLYNWVRDSKGKLLKLDAAGHTRDNTVVGTQHILWDIAGAAIELGFDEDELLKETGLEAVGEHFQFYRCAYLAFWMGMAKMTIDVSGSTPAMEREFSRYLSSLEAELSKL